MEPMPFTVWNWHRNILLTAGLVVTLAFLGLIFIYGLTDDPGTLAIARVTTVIAILILIVYAALEIVCPECGARMKFISLYLRGRGYITPEDGT